ncbi:GNAT family N-acetyltransferase [Shewanella psychropiezotolerans]|uniref:GNAT family N-acetyltransferase n=1 Tax=Shewanella psychropiezotolerans TaxID=2593655 RepID=A0ABX5WXP1_9GAMM|nr:MULTISPECIES: GNAT family N-acetyltransferase [Shewanella]MPY22746.1 GNAT family N-acetyltransferase [Shewanella sp. YLB-07]QDO82972.1 GNAT family N-acetyltransferase [Shewanella psychropiezotolerans]
MKIEVINEEDSAVFDELVAGVREHKYENMGPEETLPLSVVARDEDNELIGGVSGQTIYRNFLIDVVWVDKKTRGTGLGRRLMELAEVEAKKRGCLTAQLDTLSYQAPVFYQKMGFEIVGTVPEFPGSPARYFMLKNYK